MLHGSWKRRCFTVASILCLSVVCLAQTDVPNKAQIMQQMRMLYYTPTTAGLRTISCRATVDWHAVLQNAAAGRDVPRNDPRLVYLSQVYMSYLMRLDGSSVANWNQPPGPVPGNAAALEQMKEGTQKALEGFVKVWSIFLNGTFLPNPREANFQLAHSDDGTFLLTANQPGTSVEEKLSTDYTLTDYHAKANGNDVDLVPTFAKTDEGLLLTGLVGTFGSGTPVTAHLTLEGKYQKVGDYQVLQTLNVAVLNVGKFSFTFDNCQVNPEDAGTSPTPSTKPD